MRVVKLVLTKPNSEWRAGPFSLDKSCMETESFDFEVLDPLLQRAVRKAQSTFGVIRIVDLKDTDPTWVIPNIEEPKVEEIKQVEVVKEEPKIDPMKPMDAEIEIAVSLEGHSVSKVKEAVRSWPQDMRAKRIILWLLNAEKSQAKPRKTLVSFLEDTFLAIPEGE